MASFNENIDLPVVHRAEDFDQQSGVWLERFLFNYRPLVLLFCLIGTLLLGWQAAQLQVNASFEKMVPGSHPFVKNALANQGALRGMGNSLRVVVENTRGDIFDAAYLKQLQKVNDALYLLPGVDRGWMRGLWTPNVRWTEVTEEGFRGGPVMPDRWNGSPKQMEELRANVLRANIVGEYVSGDFRSSMIVAPLVAIDPDTQQPLDYYTFSQSVEKTIRSLETDGVKVRIGGFAKLVGDLIDGLYQVLVFFAASVLIAAACVAAYTRCWRSTTLLVIAALLGVVWLLGLMRLMGYVLDPYTVLVPFLIFAIGLSHGAQKMNGVMQDIGRGTHRYVAARYTFRRLFVAGLTALLTNVVGFAVLMVIDIPIIRDMAITTSIGITVLVITKLMLIPVMLSYVGVSRSAALRSVAANAQSKGLLDRVFFALEKLTQRRAAIMCLIAAGALTAGALVLRTGLQVGDLSAGAPELRPDSRYNTDAAFITRNFGLSNDQFVVMLKTPAGECLTFDALLRLDEMGAHMRQIEGVSNVFSAADGVRFATSGSFEGNPKWMSIVRNTSNLRGAYGNFTNSRPDLSDVKCDVLPMVASLEDHKASTLTRLVDTMTAYGREHGTPQREVQLAAGNAGIEAATNIVVKSSFWTMHAVLYGAVILLCLVTFRSWRATVVAVIPLVLTSLLCEALMVLLGIGLKVATLPVIAVGVGVGVDYALYLLSVQLAAQRRGKSLRDAYAESLNFTGRIVALVGVTMAAGVVTWIWSPIKFQADMGILLTFMFLWNMVGALTLIPALSHFLLQSASEKNTRSTGNSGAPQVGIVI